MIRKPFCEKWSFKKVGGYFQIVDLPHDAMILEQRDSDSPGGSAGAFFPAGKYVYEKTFSVPNEWKDKVVQFQFDGVYRNSIVYINDKKAGGRPYGYIPFFVNTEGLLAYGENNTIRVEVDNSRLPDSRWYTGSGIYRPVWMWIGDKAYIKPEGVKISTVSYNPAKIRIDTEHTGGEVAVEILLCDELVTSGSGDNIEIDIPNAKLWNVEAPNLYTCRVTLNNNGVVTDTASETFGIRLVEWNPKGLFINGVNTLLRGACVHSDNGILGARSYPETEERRVRILKENGYNAIRSSHNPASKSMLEACDRIGMYMIDETWDMWRGKKSMHDYADYFDDNYIQDIEALVSRDFNHPSVIMYSIGNEISDPHKKEGVDLARDMVERFKKLDQNRAVTCGVNLWLIHRASKGKGIYKEDGGLSLEKDQKGKKKKKEKASGSLFFNMMVNIIGTGMNKASNSKSADRVNSPFVDLLDIAGYNYTSGRYRKDGKIHPERVIYGSETFPQDIAKNWAMVKQLPYLIGDFMWTGWDYLGETGLGGWSYTNDGSGFGKPYPWILADCGALDILGNPTGEMFHAAAVWGKLGKPAICVRPVNHPGVNPQKAVWRGTNSIPSWSWHNCTGNKAIIEVFFDSYTIELLLNGKSRGRKKAKDCRAMFKLPYEAGSLSAIAYDSAGKEIARGNLQSASGKRMIRLTPETEDIKAGEVIHVAVDIVGENGIVESNADTQLSIDVDGGELLAFGSANPRTEETYISGSFKTYYGRSMVVLRVGSGDKVVVKGSGDGVETVAKNISIENLYY